MASMLRKLVLEGVSDTARTHSWQTWVSGHRVHPLHSAWLLLWWPSTARNFLASSSVTELIPVTMLETYRVLPKAISKTKCIPQNYRIYLTYKPYLKYTEKNTYRFIKLVGNSKLSGTFFQTGPLVTESLNTGNGDRNWALCLHVAVQSWATTKSITQSVSPFPHFWNTKAMVTGPHYRGFKVNLYLSTGLGQAYNFHF